ncbi:heterodisulfide reductase-related iron-sulfur binding cluster [Thermodesulfobacteriota bacterium]
MENQDTTEVSYFPGCSLVSTARENKVSMDYLLQHLGIHLKELEDWNCCGSSSAHSIDAGLANDLVNRNLSLAPPDKPLMVACPNCLLRLRSTHLHLKNDKKARIHYEIQWGKPFNSELKILHFFEFLDGIDLRNCSQDHTNSLKGLRFVPYYGCMLAHPPTLKHEKNYHGLIEKILTSLDAEALRWGHSSRCCGTFLSVARSDIVTNMVNRIVGGAIKAGADCIITACAMCQMNLEVRCNLKQQIPILHFSEILALALGLGKDKQKGWFSRHLVDPKPFLKAINLLRP